MSDLADQIADELGRAGETFAALLGADLAQVLRQRADDAAPRLADQLTQDTDDQLAAGTAVDLMAVLWPNCPPEGIDPGWWRTPLGRMVARSVGRDDSDAVTFTVAAAMLGRSPSTVKTMVYRDGSLERHPDGGVTRASVLARLAR